jgi:hypothetical protein
LPPAQREHFVHRLIGDVGLIVRIVGRLEILKGLAALGFGTEGEISAATSDEQQRHRKADHVGADR